MKLMISSILCKGWSPTVFSACYWLTGSKFAGWY